MIKNGLSDWLLVSDIDGTLNNKRHQLPHRNYEAIDRFINGEGGNFSLASGRGVYAIQKHFDRLPGCKNPVVVYNGAGIYDMNEKKFLWFCPIEERLRNFVAEVIGNFPKVEVEIHTPDAIYQVNSGISNMAMRFLKRPNTIRVRHIYDVPSENWAKVIFYGTPVLITEIRSFVKLHRSITTNFMDSSPMTYEMVNEDTNKWKAIQQLARMMEIDEKKIAVIGNHYNDYEMLKNAPISACCGQSPRGIKYVAKMQTCHCNFGAVADLIEFLEKNYIDYSK